MYLARQAVDRTDGARGASPAGRARAHPASRSRTCRSPSARAVPGTQSRRAPISSSRASRSMAEVVARVEAREIVVSAYGIREGLLLETARVTPTVADPGEARARSVRELAERTHYEAPHAQHVQSLALQLFDAIGDRYRLRARRSRDSGRCGAPARHRLPHQLQQAPQALIPSDPARRPAGHDARGAGRGRERRALPPRRGAQEIARGLRRSSTGPLRRRVRRLAAILRVADGFDRGHAGAVARIKVRWLGRAMRLTAVPAKSGSHAAPRALGREPQGARCWRRWPVSASRSWPPTVRSSWPTRGRDMSRGRGRIDSEGQSRCSAARLLIRGPV